MSNVENCFVCGTDLAVGGKPRAEVTGGADGDTTKEFCMRCWFKVSEALELFTGDEGVEYGLRVKYGES